MKVLGIVEMNVIVVTFSSNYSDSVPKFPCPVDYALNYSHRELSEVNEHTNQTVLPKCLRYLEFFNVYWNNWSSSSTGLACGGNTPRFVMGFKSSSTDLSESLLSI